MKKILFIALLAVLAASTASAQTDFYNWNDAWEKTITVPNSQATTIEKLFTAWGKEFPGWAVDAFNEHKKTGKAKDIRIKDRYSKVDFAPKNGFIEIYTADTTIFEGANHTFRDTTIYDYTLTAVYWNLQNGNKLFGVCYNHIGEYYLTTELGFYEYDAAKGVMTPRTDITQRVKEITDGGENFVQLPKEGRDIKHDGGVIKWNGNGF